MHLTEEQVQRVLHREEAGKDISGHLGTCADCQETVSRARRDEAEILGLLGAVDSDPPPLTAGDIANQSTMVRQHPPRRLRWAAVILLGCVAGGAAYALPGSPLKSWLTRLFQEDSIAVIDSAAQSRETSPTPAVSGIAVDPGSVLTIVFDPPRIGSRARVTVSDESRVSVEGPTGQVLFTSEPDRLRVTLLGDSVTILVRIPQGANRVEVRLGDRPVLIKRGTAVDTRYPPDPTLGYLIPLTP